MAYIVYNIKKYFFAKYANDHRQNIFLRFDNLSLLLDKAVDTAWYKVYNDDILVYIKSQENITSSVMHIILKKYLKMVFTCCGKNVTQDLIDIYGDMEALCTILTNDFYKKVISNERIMMDKALGEKLGII